MIDREYFESLVISVGQWSEYNFGDQGGFDHLAPFLGMFEELGEYYSVISDEDTKVQEENKDPVSPSLDAKCDLFIYYCDYLYRSGDDFHKYNDLDFSVLPDGSPEKESLLNIFAVLSKLSHVELKRIQGIRKFDDYDYYCYKKKLLIQELHRLILSFVNSSEDFKPALDYVWKRVVSKRNWKTVKDGQ